MRPIIHNRMKIVEKDYAVLNQWGIIFTDIRIFTLCSVVNVHLSQYGFKKWCVF